jgi:hypothetical protein
MPENIAIQYVDLIVQGTAQLPQTLCPSTLLDPKK